MTDQTRAQDAAREIAEEWLDLQGFDWVGTGTQKSGAIERQMTIESLSKWITAALLAQGAAERARAIEECAKVAGPYSLPCAAAIRALASAAPATDGENLHSKGE